MKKEKITVYLYTRVSTTLQIDGYSLDAQKTKMKTFCDYNEYEIAGEYEDAGKSGKSIEGRVSFNQMMEDIKSGKDGVSYVFVFKLSRFGRNAADVLATLQVMQDFGVNLICVEDGIDSSKDAGKLMISVLSAVAEIERENIHVQTMEGRVQKAREGKWNGGFAPYGYSLIDGKLEVNEEESGIGQFEQAFGIIQSGIGQLETAYKKIPFKLSWTHYQILMRIEDKDERDFYEKEAICSNWNVSTLKRQFHSSLYERLALSRDKNDVMRLANEGAVPQKPEDILHTPYVLEFAGLEDKAAYHESDLESAVIGKMQKNGWMKNRIDSEGRVLSDG